jgi:hypothetical protein
MSRIFGLSLLSRLVAPKTVSRSLSVLAVVRTAPVSTSTTLTSNRHLSVPRLAAPATISWTNTVPRRAYSAPSTGPTEAEIVERAVKVVKGFERVDPAKVTGQRYQFASYDCANCCSFFFYVVRTRWWLDDCALDRDFAVIKTTT